MSAVNNSQTAQMKTPIYPRSAWKDRFNTPAVDELRVGLPESETELFDHARNRLLEMDGTVERASWYGEAWRWTIEFVRPDAEDSREIVAMLVPSPTNMLLVMPLQVDFLNTIPRRRMKRFVRDGLELAEPPFDTRLGVWSLQTVNLLNDLIDIAHRKLRFEESDDNGENGHHQNGTK